MTADADDLLDERAAALPQGGHADERVLLASFGLVLLAVSPVAPLCAAWTLIWLMGQLRYGWREIAALAGALTVLVGVVPQLLGAGMPGLRGWILETAVIGVPLGVAAGACAVGLLERCAAGADWHPAERRRRAVRALREGQVVDALAASGQDLPVLGVFRGGDLDPWVAGRYVRPPEGKFPAMGVIGESGSGKTVTVERLNWLWARAGTRVIFADFKGSDPELPERVIAAYLAARPAAVCQVWPTQPLDMWRGDATEIINRLLTVQDFSEPFYELAAQTAVRLAINAPDDPLPRDSATFLNRLDIQWLERAYKGKAQAPDVAALKVPQVMEGVRLRYAGFFAALGQQFDQGTSWEDADLTVLTIPTLAQPSDSMAAARMVLADFGAYCIRRKPRDERVIFVVDEFSAVTGAAPMVIDLAERVRDAGGQVVVCVQSFEGLGRGPGERMRMLDALATGGIILHRTGNPAEVLHLAGTKHQTALSWTLDRRGRTGSGSVRMDRTLLVDPDHVRRLMTGGAYVLTHGRALEMLAMPTLIRPDAAATARQMIQEAAGAAEAARLRADWWEKRNHHAPPPSPAAAPAAAADRPPRKAPARKAPARKPRARVVPEQPVLLDVPLPAPPHDDQEAASWE